MKNAASSRVFCGPWQGVEGRPGGSGSLAGKAEQNMRLFNFKLSFQVLGTKTAERHDQFGGNAIQKNVVIFLALLNLLDNIRLRALPACTSKMGNSFVRVPTHIFRDVCNLDHLPPHEVLVGTFIIEHKVADS